MKNEIELSDIYFDKREIPTRRELWNKIEGLQSRLTITEKALELAAQQLDDAKDMLRECGKRDWAGMLDTSAYYFKSRAKEILKNE